LFIKLLSDYRTVLAAGTIAVVVMGCASEPPEPRREATASVESNRLPASDETPRETPPPQLPAVADVQDVKNETPAPDNVVTAKSNDEPTTATESSVTNALALEPEPKALKQAAGGAQTVFYRLDAKLPAVIPPVLLSKGHEAICRVKVGDAMPAVELQQLGGGKRALAGLAGEKATVVVFWKSDRRMARQQLADVRPDVLEPFGKSGVAVIGIAVNESAADAEAALERAGADFPNLLDPDGKAFAAVGSQKLPRTYLLDPQGKILWFDLEYSQATRRELHQALRAILAENP
jgi:peroxiredoxin